VGCWAWLSASISWIAGCGIIEPEKVKPKANQPPETVITAGPVQGSTFSYFARIGWKGEDYDGLVVGFRVAVDDTGRWVSTRKTDSTFVFSAPNADTPHTVYVAAVDEEGAVDPTPASVTFTATNVAPDTRIEIEGNPREGATFGLGQTFTIRAVNDPDNGPQFDYRFRLDATGNWSEWLRNNVVEFGEASPFGRLPAGPHTFFAQVRDAAGAVDPTPASFPFVASTTVRPTVSLTATYNGLPFYSDNSAFYFTHPDSQRVVRFQIAADASSYFGRLGGVKLQLDTNPATPYGAITDTSFANLTEGEHTLRVRVKDTGGAESEEVVFAFKLVKFTLSPKVLVVDESNGRFATDANADAFYSTVLTTLGKNFTPWDVREKGDPTPGSGFGDYGLVIWESDEAFFGNFARAKRLLAEYLDAGGHLWITGWKPIQQLAGTTPVTNFQSADPWVYKYLKLQTAKQSPGSPADFTGASGMAGYPNINVDQAKNFVPAFQNRLPTIDVFTLRSDATAEAVYTFNSASGNPDFNGATCGMRYLGSDWKVVVFGFPFYFMKNDEAIEAARKVFQDLGP